MRMDNIQLGITIFKVKLLLGSQETPSAQNRKRSSENWQRKNKTYLSRFGTPFNKDQVIKSTPAAKGMTSREF